MQQSRVILWICFYWDGKVLRMCVEWKGMFYSSLCSVLSFIYGHTSFYCTLVYCALQILHYFTNSRFVQPWVEQVYQRCFSSSILSLCVSVSQVGDSSNISSLRLFFIFAVVISELWYYCCKKIDLLKPQMIVNIFSNKVFSFFFFLPHHKAGRILVSGPGIETVLPAVEAQSLNHWTTRQIPIKYS